MGAPGCDRFADGSTWVIHPCSRVTPANSHSPGTPGDATTRCRGQQATFSQMHITPSPRGRTDSPWPPPEAPTHAEQDRDTAKPSHREHTRTASSPWHQCQSSLLCRCFPLCLFGTNALGRIVITTHNNGSTLLLKQQNGGSGDGGCGGAQLRSGSYQHSKRAGQPTNKRFLRMQFSLFNYQQFWKKKCSLVWISKPWSWTVPSAGR